MESSYYFSRSAERNARMTSSRLFSLISSSANKVGRSSCGASTGLAASAKRFGDVARAGTGRTGPDGVSLGGETEERDAAGATRVVCGSGAPGMRRLAGLEAPGGAGCQGSGAFGATGLGATAAFPLAAAGRACAEAAGLARQFPRVNARFARSLSLRPAAGIELWRQLPGGGFGLMMTAAVTVYAVFLLVLLVARQALWRTWPPRQEPSWRR